MSVERLVRVSCDAQFEPVVEDLRRGPCEVDSGDVYHTVEEALRAIRGAGWTVGRGPDGRAGYVRCPACAAAKRHDARLRVVARRLSADDWHRRGGRMVDGPRRSVVNRSSRWSGGLGAVRATWPAKAACEELWANGRVAYHVIGKMVDPLLRRPS